MGWLMYSGPDPFIEEGSELTGGEIETLLDALPDEPTWEVYR